MMKVTVKQVMSVFIGFVVSLAVLRGAQTLYTSSVIRTPLVRTIEHVPGVQRVTMGPKNAIAIDLTPTANLMTSYQTVTADATRSLGQAPRQITLVNHATGAMIAVTNQLRFVVAQGIATGQYVAMNDSIQQMAARAHLTANVELGTNHVYVTLSSSKGHYHTYLVLPSANTTTGGGGHV